IMQLPNADTRRTMYAKGEGHCITAAIAHFLNPTHPFILPKTPPNRHRRLKRTSNLAEDTKTSHRNTRPVREQSAAAQYGFEVREIAQDGNCLFRAVADQLHHHFGVTFPGQLAPHAVLRRVAANHIISNVGLYQPFTDAQSSTAVEELIAKLEQAGEWAGEEALVALSRAFQVTIAVIQSHDPDNVRVYKPTQQHGSAHGTRVVYLHYTNRSHYESLQRGSGTNRLRPASDIKACIERAAVDTGFSADVSNTLPMATLIASTSQAMDKEYQKVKQWTDAQRLRGDVKAIAKPSSFVVDFFVERETGALKALLNTFAGKTTKQRVLHLVAGPGAIGKTQLALKFWTMQEKAGNYDYRLWLSAESREQLVKAYLGMAQPLGIKIDERDTKKAIAQVKACLDTKRCLYVFDDVSSYNAIQDLLPQTQGHILVTTRKGDREEWPGEVSVTTLAPFGQSTLLAMARKYGCKLAKEEQATIKYLLEELSGYPLILAQFFSYCKTSNMRPAASVQDLRSAKPSERDTLIVKELLAKAPKRRAIYSHSMLQVLKRSLEALQKEEAGDMALSLLRRFASLSHKGIPTEWILTLDGDNQSLGAKNQIRKALSLLRKYSLIIWNEATKDIELHVVTQRVIRHLYPEKALHTLAERLMHYTGTRPTRETASRWIWSIPHGERLYAKLDKKTHAQTGYTLALHLYEAYAVAYSYANSSKWAQEAMKYAAGLAPEECAYVHSIAGTSFARLLDYEQALKYKQEVVDVRR
ncbi:MAG: NB-ARC domain-containing protein, partial [Bacteroidota bacterium]